MKLQLSCLLFFFCSAVSAQDLRQPITVAAVPHGVFQHFEASGRTMMAVSQGTVGIVWEDNRSGQPQIYVAFKDRTATVFTAPIQVSKNGPAYEPAIAANKGHFIIGWEASDHLWLRSVSPHQQGPVIALSKAAAHQLTLVATPQQTLAAAWGEHDGKNYSIHTAELIPLARSLRIEHRRAVDTSTDRNGEFYPTLTVTELGTAVAWEDRRQGATRIFTAFAPAGKAFEPYRVLNQFRYSVIRKYGNGTGAMRVVLSSDHKRNVMAIWLDKRDFVQGYDVYAAFSHDGGRTFAKDEKVQDPLGDNLPQWHPTIAMSAKGRIAAAWDDSRDGTPDIWFSHRQQQQWQGDDVWPGGNGAGAQTQPVLIYEGETLHAAWLSQHEGKSAILYSQP